MGAQASVNGITPLYNTQYLYVVTLTSNYDRVICVKITGNDGSEYGTSINDEFVTLRAGIPYNYAKVFTVPSNNNISDIKLDFGLGWSDKDSAGQNTSCKITASNLSIAKVAGGETIPSETTTISEKPTSSLETTSSEITTASTETTTSVQEVTTTGQTQQSTTAVVTTKKQDTTTSTASETKKVAKAKVAKINVKKKASSKAKISLKKTAGAKGYVVQISTSKKFKKILVKKTVKKITFTIKSKKIKNKSKLYVRVKAYKLVNKDKVYGEWSTAKKIKIKK